MILCVVLHLDDTEFLRCSHPYRDELDMYQHHLNTDRQSNEHICFAIHQDAMWNQIQYNHYHHLWSSSIHHQCHSSVILCHDIFGTVYHILHFWGDNIFLHCLYRLRQLQNMCVNHLRVDRRNSVHIFLPMVQDAKCNRSQHMNYVNR